MNYFTFLFSTDIWCLHGHHINNPFVYCETHIYNSFQDIPVEEVESLVRSKPGEAPRLIGFMDAESNQLQGIYLTVDTVFVKMMSNTNVSSAFLLLLGVYYVYQWNLVADARKNSWTIIYFSSDNVGRMNPWTTKLSTRRLYMDLFQTNHNKITKTIHWSYSVIHVCTFCYHSNAYI